MEYLTVAEAASQLALTPRSVQLHCMRGNVSGATLHGKSWRIPIGAAPPLRLLDACRAGQHVFIPRLQKFGYGKLAEKSGAVQE